jgi:hypothetical protein
MRLYRSQLLAGKKEGAELKLLASLRRPSNALPTESQRQHQAKRYAYFLQVFLTRLKKLGLAVPPSRARPANGRVFVCRFSTTAATKALASVLGVTSAPAYR